MISDAESDKKLNNALDLLSVSRADKKRLEYLKNLKDKKYAKKIQKKEQNNKLNSSTNSENLNNVSEKEVKSEKENKNDKQVKDEKKHLSEQAIELNKLLTEENIEIEYVDETSESKIHSEFKHVFDYFLQPKKPKKNLDYDDELSFSDNNSQDLNPNKENEPKVNMNKLSKKKKKLLKRIKISDLKQIAPRPEVVEAWDATSNDPILLVNLKSQRNSVPVPKHWSQKRKFLQNKRGVLKQPFKLPGFIEDTGITKIRDNTGNDRKALKLKMKERMQPKLGKMDIDYQVLHDAFFKHQMKPLLTVHGDIYYENKETEQKMKVYKPGRISEKLRVALGIPENSPPPWIINMQRYGPPPAYPNLKIPGVNAPIMDPTADITPNLWTAPAEEETGEPLFLNRKRNNEGHWGDLLEEDEEVSEAGEDMSISDLDDTFANNTMSGMETPEIKVSKNVLDGAYNLSKALGSASIPDPNENIKGIPNMDKELFKVIEQVPINVKKNEIFGSSHVYNIENKDKYEGGNNIKEAEDNSIINEDNISKVSTGKQPTTGTTDTSAKVNEPVPEKKKEKKDAKYKKIF